MTIQQTVKEARLRNHYSQRQLGELCGYPRGSAQMAVSQWELGKRPIPLEKIRTVARILHIPIESLIP